MQTTAALHQSTGRTTHLGACSIACPMLHAAATSPDAPKSRSVGCARRAPAVWMHCLKASKDCRGTRSSAIVFPCLHSHKGPTCCAQGCAYCGAARGTRCRRNSPSTPAGHLAVGSTRGTPHGSRTCPCAARLQAPRVHGWNGMPCCKPRQAGTPFVWGLPAVPVPAAPLQKAPPAGHRTQGGAVSNQ